MSEKSKEEMAFIKMKQNMHKHCRAEADKYERITGHRVGEIKMIVHVYEELAYDEVELDAPTNGGGEGE